MGIGSIFEILAKGLGLILGFFTGKNTPEMRTAAAAQTAINTKDKIENAVAKKNEEETRRIISE